MVVFHCGINQKHNPTLIPKAHQIPANTNHKPVPSLARALAMLYEFQGIRTPRLSCILAVLFPGSALPCGRPNPKLGGTNGFCKKQQQENPGEIQTHLEEQRMLIWVWLWHMQGKKRSKRSSDGKRRMARFLPALGILVPPCPGNLSWMVHLTLHSFPKHTYSSQQGLQAGTFLGAGLGVALQVSDSQDCQSWLHCDVLLLGSAAPWRKPNPKLCRNDWLLKSTGQKLWTDSDPPGGADDISLGVSGLVASVEKEEKEAGESLVGKGA